MSNLPNQGVLASYWIPQVGIGPSGQMDYVDVPLTDVLNYTLPNGQPQTNIVYLFCASFTSTTALYVTIPDAIMQQMTLQPGQSQTNVQQLQAAGIKVLLSLIGSNGIGWDAISDPTDFAQWVSTNIVDQYGLDGIDIDNENGGATDTQNFVNTIGALRGALSGGLITKALWNDNQPGAEYFTVPVAAGFPNAGAYLGQLLDVGSTMYYGYDYGTQIAYIQSYQNIMVGSTNVGMNWNQLSIGVQAGPVGGGWMTGIDEVYRLAQWSVAQDSPPILGIMLFTFSQDIQQFTFSPQNSPSKMFPNADDHEWQRTIIAGFLGEPQPSD
ncbi:MAG TPA: glycosyl hydrolase family 18 protein [Pyrinomonadaceae bacterium]|nr:glycosyl hydrolase family 18 protein [Pyrinomonadaceae bacterium]